MYKNIYTTHANKITTNIKDQINLLYICLSSKQFEAGYYPLYIIKSDLSEHEDIYV